MDSEVVRGKPLTKNETKLFLGLIESSPIILSKTTNAASNKMKNEEWVCITRTFNATATVCRRTPQKLRLKWENLKKLARKRSTKIRMNCIQTGGGIPEYIPPDDILDRVADLLGSTASGFVVPFGGDKEEGVFVCGGGIGGGDKEEGVFVCGGGIGGGDGGGDDSGDVLAGQAKVRLESVLVSLDTNMGTTIPVSINNDRTPFDTSIPLSIVNSTKTLIPNTVDLDIEVNECELAGKAGQCTLRTPKRLTLSTPRIGKKKIKTSDGSGFIRNVAIAEYYTAKKQCLDVKKEYILLQNEKLKLEIEKLRGEKVQ